MPKTSFTTELRELADPLWSRELTHPFVSGIGDGTLEIEKFQFFLKQDYIFLVEFSRAISIAAAKAKELDDMA
ncbi:MAG: thiaminase II, partial [Chloroflexota bacterium]|nr:thiaminase II [Chloroflexota bacterium]